MTGSETSRRGAEVAMPRPANGAPAPDLFAFVVHNSADALIVTDAAGTVRFCNTAAAALFGRSPMAMVGRRLGVPVGFVEPQEIDVVGAGGELRAAELRSSHADLGGERMHVLVLRDSTARIEKLRELERAALTDELTGLANRRLFLAIGEQQLALARRASHRFCLLFVDLDNMKQINDTAGHEQGDQALIDAASVITCSVRASDLVARIGGDEFAVLLAGPESATLDDHPVVQRLRANIKLHNREAGRPYTVALSVGSAAFDCERPVALEELLKRADRAMYEAKRAAKASASILAVVGDNGVRELLGSTLGADHDLSFVSDHLPALTAALRRAPDLVVIEGDAEGRRPTAVIRTLRDDPVTAGLPAIVIAATDAHGQEVACLRAGADDFVPAGVDGDVLAARVARVLARSQRGASGGGARTAHHHPPGATST